MGSDASAVVVVVVAVLHWQVGVFKTAITFAQMTALWSVFDVSPEACAGGASQCRRHRACTARSHPQHLSRLRAQVPWPRPVRGAFAVSDAVSKLPVARSFRCIFHLTFLQQLAGVLSAPWVAALALLLVPLVMYVRARRRGAARPLAGTVSTYMACVVVVRWLALRPRVHARNVVPPVDTVPIAQRAAPLSVCHEAADATL